MTAPELAAEEVRAILRYDPQTGALCWTERAVRFRGQQAGRVTSRGGHIQIKIKGRAYQGHRLAWLCAHGEWPKGWVDHINGDPADNRLANLRVVTPLQSTWNRGAHAHSKSGIKGAHWHAKCQKWQAAIRVGRATKHLGLYVTPEEAHAAYMKASAELRGEYERRP